MQLTQCTQLKQHATHKQMQQLSCDTVSLCPHMSLLASNDGIPLHVKSRKEDETTPYIPPLECMCVLVYIKIHYKLLDVKPPTVLHSCELRR